MTAKKRKSSLTEYQAKAVARYCADRSYENFCEACEAVMPAANRIAHAVAAGMRSDEDAAASGAADGTMLALQQYDPDRGDFLRFLRLKVRSATSTEVNRAKKWSGLQVVRMSDLCDNDGADIEGLHTMDGPAQLNRGDRREELRRVCDELIGGAGLTRRERRVVELRLDGYMPARIAEILGDDYTSEVVYYIQARARKKMRDYAQENGFESPQI